MIDFIKLQTQSKKTKLESLITSSVTVNAIGTYNYGTNELCYPIKANFQNMEVRLTSNYGIIKNSIHKYYNLKANQENQNFNDFTYLDFILAVFSLQKDIGMLIDDFAITNLEFGFNLNTLFSPKNIIEQNVIFYEFNEANQFDAFKGKGCYKQFNKSEFALKVYDKGLQYSQSENIMRVELKITDSRFLKKLGINVLSDLFYKDNLDKLFYKFIEIFDKLVIVDMFSDNVITDLDKQMLDKGKNPSYWRELSQNSSRTTLYNAKKQYKKLIEKLGYDSIKNDLKNAIVLKYQDLTRDNFVSKPVNEFLLKMNKIDI